MRELPEGFENPVNRLKNLFPDLYDLNDKQTDEVIENDILPVQDE